MEITKLWETQLWPDPWLFIYMKNQGSHNSGVIRVLAPNKLYRSWYLWNILHRKLYKTPSWFSAKYYSFRDIEATILRTTQLWANTECSSLDLEAYNTWLQTKKGSCRAFDGEYFTVFGSCVTCSVKARGSLHCCDSHIFSNSIFLINWLSCIYMKVWAYWTYSVAYRYVEVNYYNKVCFYYCFNFINILLLIKYLF